MFPAVSSDIDAINLALLGLRLILAAVMLAHGIRHIFGGGKIAGTGRWFESLGMKPGAFHAWTASVTEVGAGACLALGFLTPFGCAGVVGTMTVALITNHLKNGFFIFNKGEGYEYVLTLIVVAVCLGALGPGEWSVDNGLDLTWVAGNSGLAWAAGAGFGGAAALLAAFWRPAKTAA